MSNGNDGEQAATPTVTRLFEPVVTPIAEINTPVSTSTPNPTDVPNPTVMSIEDQILAEDGLLKVRHVQSERQGWVVIYNDVAGKPGEILGYAEVPAGESEDLEVTVNPYIASPNLYAIFHLDGGQSDVFEFPGTDTPELTSGEVTEEIFAVDIQIYQPSIIASSQAVAEDGVIVIQEAKVTEPAWLVLNADEEGEAGAILAYAPLKPGINDNVTLSIAWHTAPPLLHAVIYSDGGNIGVFEDASSDQPMVVNGDPVATSFEVTYPPDIYILNQPVANGEVVIERVIGYEPSWLVIYNQNEEETLGNIIGWSKLKPGINTQVTVSVTESAVTTVLYAMLHEDLEDLGEFGFPSTDPVILFDGAIHPFDFRTDSGNYLIIRDQPVSAQNTITVPLVVVEQDSWLVIYNDEDGQVGEISGRRWVPAGINRDIEVTLNDELTTSVMHGVLHLDAGTARVFDFPDGQDIPFQRNRSIIQTPFSIIDREE